MKIYNSHGNWWHDSDTCPSCNVILSLGNSDYNAGRNGVTAGGSRGNGFTAPSRGQQKKIKYCYKDFLGNQKIRDINKRRKQRLLNIAPAQEYFNWVDVQKESSIIQRVVSIKTRNSTIYDKLKESYDYTCQIESCQETEVEFAHILRHSHPDSVDNITNGWCVCRNHHKAYDSNRMIVETNGDFVRYDVHGKIIEYGRIVYNDLHKVNPKFITLAREYWNDREEQEVG